MQKDILKGIACVMLSIVIWSGWMVVSRFAVKGTLSAYDIAAIRFTTAGLLLLPVAIRRGLRIGPWGLWSGFFFSVLMGAPYTVLAVTGMQFAPASHAATLINGTVLVVTTVLSIHGLRESTSVLRITGVACSAVGIVCMLIAKSVYGGAYQWLGHLLFVASGLMWAFYIVLVRKWRVDALDAATVICVFSLITYMPFYLLFAHSHISLDNWHEVAFQSVYQGLFTGVIALITFNKGVELLGASHASAFIPLVPVFSTLLAIPVLKEFPSVLEWCGVFAVSSGVFLASGVLHWRPKNKRQN